MWLAGLSVIGYTAASPLAALRRALAIRRPAPGLIHHSDRGSQYGSIVYQAELRRHDARISMSGKGDCYDNAMVGNTATLRHHFSRATALSPREYRNRFNHRAHGDIDDES